MLVTVIVLMARFVAMIMVAINGVVLGMLMIVVQRMRATLAVIMAMVVVGSASNGKPEKDSPEGGKS